jgi:hypothetical protein
MTVWARPAADRVALGDGGGEPDTRNELRPRSRSTTLAFVYSIAVTRDRSCRFDLRGANDPRGPAATNIAVRYRERVAIARTVNV